MLILSDYRYYRPSTVEEAKALLQDGNVLIAGGSDVMPQLKTAVISPNALVDLSRIEELSQVKEREDGIHIGAMAVLSHLAKNSLILEKIPAISQAARNVASPQIRNRGTIGGNVLQARRCIYYNQTKEWRQGIPRCFKVGGDRCLQIPNSPVCRAIYYSDMAPVLLAYDAQVVVETPEGRRTLSCQELVDRHCEDRDQPQLVREFWIPRAAYQGAWGKFHKYSLRGSIDFPIINFAARLQQGTVTLTAGAIATRVLRLSDTEAYIKEAGNAFDPAQALETALSEMKKKSQIVREAGISVPVKRGTFRYIAHLLEEVQRAM